MNQLCNMFWYHNNYSLLWDSLMALRGLIILFKSIVKDSLLKFYSTINLSLYYSLQYYGMDMDANIFIDLPIHHTRHDFKHILQVQ
jgi:hypothetical protein